MAIKRTVSIFSAGKLSLKKTINTYFPSIKNGEKIIIGHWLSHRSGIHNFTSDIQYPGWQTQKKTKEQMIEIIAKGK